MEDRYDQETLSRFVNVTSKANCLKQCHEKLDAQWLLKPMRDQRVRDWKSVPTTNESLQLSWEYVRWQTPADIAEVLGSSNELCVAVGGLFPGLRWRGGFLAVSAFLQPSEHIAALADQLQELAIGINIPYLAVHWRFEESECGPHKIGLCFVRCSDGAVIDSGLHPHAKEWIGVSIDQCKDAGHFRGVGLDKFDVFNAIFDRAQNYSLKTVYLATDGWIRGEEGAMLVKEAVEELRNRGLSVVGLWGIENLPNAWRGAVRINGLAQLLHLPKSGSASKRMQIALDSAGTGAEDDKDLLNKFLETRTGNRVSATEGRVRNWRKQNSGKTASNGNHVTALDAVTHRVPRSRSMPEESAFSSTHNIYDRSPVVALPQKMGVPETSSQSVSGMESSSFLTQKAELSEPVREILRIANNLPQNHSLEDCLVEFTHKILVVEGNLVLKVLGEDKLFVQALSFFQWMRLHKPCLLDSRSFSIIFNLLGKAKMIDEALALYWSLPSDKTVHSVKVYNTLLTALSNCDRHEEIFAVLEQMQATGTEPDSVTFSILITEARKGKDGLHKVLGVYRCMMERGVRPDVTAFGSLIKAFCDTRHPKEALLAAIEMERLGMPLNVIIYNTLIDAYGKVGELEEMEGLVVEMKERGLEPNKKTFNILIHCYGCHGQYKVAEALMQEIEAAGLKPDVVTFTALIGAYGKQKMSDKAASVFNRMRNAGVTPNAYSYTALINAYSEGHWHEKAAMVFERMRQDGISPSVETYTALLDGYRRAGNIEMVKEVWKTMREENCAGTRVTFVTLVDAFAKQGLLRDARDVIFEFEKLGHKPDLMIYNMLLNAYCRGGNHRKGPEILHEIRSAGLKPDSFSYCTLIYAFLRVRDFTKAYKYHEEMMKKGKSPDTKTYAKLRAILKVSLQRKQVNDQKANAGQTPRQRSLGKIPENAKSFWKRGKRPSRRLLR